MKYQQPTIENCSQEPIHIIGSIQSIGYLLVLDKKDFRIVQASENTHQLLDCSADEVVGGFLDDFFNFSFLEYFHEKIDLNNFKDRQSFRFEHQLKPYILTAYDSDGFLVMEVENDQRQNRENNFLAYSELVDRITEEWENMHGVQEICQHTIERLRPMLGFDRMMVYHFDEDDHGEVIAEHKEKELDSYLGLKFPETDIPAQARELYLKNILRGIYDVDDKPVAIVPQERKEDGKPLDLSKSALRSVSPIHIEYLRNMGVKASFSISLVVNGKLWGMILCHHTQKPVSLDVHQRRSCRFISKLLSKKIESLREEQRFLYQKTQLKFSRNLMSTYMATKDLHESLDKNRQELLKTFKADNYALVFRGRLSSDFHSNDEAHVSDLHSLFKGENLFYSNNLQGKLPLDRMAGLLAINFSKNKTEGLYFFRNAQSQTIRWAGKPEMQKNHARLSPRNSFDSWTEQVENKSERWHPAEIEFAGEMRNTILENTILISSSGNEDQMGDLNERISERVNELESSNRQMKAELEQYRRTASKLGLEQELSKEREQKDLIVRKVN